jgi:hypothetical protein
MRDRNWLGTEEVMVIFGLAYIRSELATQHFKCLLLKETKAPVSL